MFRTLAVTASVAALAGCALGTPQQTPPALAGEALVGKRVAVTTQPPPPLKAGSVGDDLRAGYGIGDPAARIGRGVALSLVSERGMTLLLDDGAEADADYVIDVQTRDWALDPYPLSRSRYRLKYAAQLRLIDRADGRVLAESSCRSEQGDGDNPPTREALVADNAALVKGYLEMATAACVDVAVRESLRLREVGASAVAAAGAVSGSAPAAAARSARPPADLPAVPVPVISAAAAAAAGADVTGDDRRVIREPLRDTDARLVTRAAPQDVQVLTRTAPRPTAATPAPTTAPVLAQRPPTQAIVQPVAVPQPGSPPTPRLETAPRPPPPPEAALPDGWQAEQDQLLRGDTLSAAARASGQVIVLLKDTPFRDSPRHVSPVTTTLPQGMEIVVRQRIYNAEGEWWFIAVPGDVGWIPSPDPQIRR